MQRTVMQKLFEWKNSAFRKPLILRGVRQVGKTWIMQNFAQEAFAERYLYINFDSDEQLGSLFAQTKDPDKILRVLSFTYGKTIEDGWLLILDEIQNCPDAIHSLKYFQEKRPGVFVLAAGSLLGLSLAKPRSYPVGKVEFLDIEPMSFKEFLLARPESVGLAQFLDHWDELEAVPDVIFDPMIESLKMYEIVGGMPEAVSAWCLQSDITQVRKIQQDILYTYIEDIRSHASSFDAPKILRIWQTLPQILSREQKRFQYSLVEPRSNARKYGDALQWLIDAKLVRPVHRINGFGLPLSAYEDSAAFKLYLVDVGLLTRLSKVEPNIILNGSSVFREHKGALSENMILQSLSAQFESAPMYWSMTNPSYEVDFLLETHGIIVPIEVKSSTNVTSKSLKKFKSLHEKDLPLRVRFSINNLKLDGDLLNIPIFMADETGRLIDLALKKINAN
mgnify:CR=1 FL=1|jgi:predicted AAA+ superfamily ATPase